MSIEIHIEWLRQTHLVGRLHPADQGPAVTFEYAGEWLERADWCDYYATKDGKTYGIAIFDHPQNLRHPTWWMAREYGLFAANPFGQKDFEPAAKHAAGKGDYTIPAGGSLTLRYRFYFHLGDEKAADIAARYKEYAAGK